MKIKCFIFGHEFEAIAEDENGYIYACQRCGQDVVKDSFIAHMVCKIPPWFFIKHRIIMWCRPCPDCGRRFGRHNRDVEHVPF